MKKKLFLLCFLFSSLSQASAISSSEKKSHLFQTFALFNEEGQTAFFYQGGAKYWGDVSSRITLFELDSFWGKPQFILNAGVQASLRKEGKEFLSDTIDVRIGLAGLFTINSTTRLLTAISHLSGHALEDIPDKDLVPTNVGDDTIQLRLIHDYQDTFRFGGTFKYVVSSAGAIKKMSADQFFEWFPIGEKGMKDAHAGTPFLATGVEQSGIDKYILTSHLQTGVYWGNHVNPKHDEIIRVSLGWYNGLDPRQKYSHYKKSKSNFGYFGLAYEY